MEELKQMKEALISQVQGQMGNLHGVSTHELGEVIDMIKDLDESMYYCTIVKAMENKDEEEKRYYQDMSYYRDMDRPYGRMYYSGDNASMGGNRGSMNNGNYGSKGYNEYVYPIAMRDRREGRSPLSRKTYMESKEMHQDKNVQMRELENYMAELSQDISEMIQMASPEEKAILQKKLSVLSAKIV